MLGLLAAHRGEDPLPLWQANCDENGSVVDCLRTGADGEMHPKSRFTWHIYGRPPGDGRPVTREERTAAAFTRAAGAMVQCLKGPLERCRGQLVAQLMAGRHASLSPPSLIEPWLEAIDAACANVHEPVACLPLGRLHADGRNLDGAASAWADGCGTGFLNKPNCSNLMELVQKRGGRLSSEVRQKAMEKLCANHDRSLCVEAARPLLRSYGCLSKQANACRAYEKLTGEPYGGGGVGGLIEPR
jgi:hypothetical protein